MKTDYEEYESYSNDYLTHGVKLEIDHSVYYKRDCDISDLIKQSLSDVEGMCDKSIAKENEAYAKVLQAVTEWEKSALVTQRLKRAIEYIKCPAVEHTSNEWVEMDDGFKQRSNMVYIMEYRIRERESYRDGKLKFDVIWSVKTQQIYNQSVRAIDGNDTTYSSKEAAEKYINGRIKKYDNLFTDISPVIYEVDKHLFSVNGELLPGYITTAMQKEMAKAVSDKQKPSIKGQLNELKSQSKNNSNTEPAKKRSAPELE